MKPFLAELWFSFPLPFPCTSGKRKHKQRNLMTALTDAALTDFLATLTINDRFEIEWATADNPQTHITRTGTLKQKDPGVVRYDGAGERDFSFPPQRTEGVIYATKSTGFAEVPIDVSFLCPICFEPMLTAVVFGECKP